MKKKWIVLLALLFGLVVLFAACHEELPETSDETSYKTTKELEAFFPTKDDETSLEFWIADQVSEESFQGMQEKYGWMGAREFYGTGYQPTVGENGEQKDPENYVRYLVTSFPDYADDEQHVTEINWNDPTICVYGLTTEACFADFEYVFRQKGYEVTKVINEIATVYTAKKGIYSFILQSVNGERSMTIRAEVTNREGIVF